MDVTVAGVPLLAHTTLLDGADPALCGPGGTTGGRAVGVLVVVDPVPAAEPPTADQPQAGESPGVLWAWTDLPGPGRALLAVGEPGAVIARLAAGT